MEKTISKRINLTKENKQSLYFSCLPLQVFKPLLLNLTLTTLDFVFNPLPRHHTSTHPFRLESWDFESKILLRTLCLFSSALFRAPLGVDISSFFLALRHLLLKLLSS